MPKRILILTQFYPPEPCAAGNRAAAVAQAFASAGHSVTVLTGLPSFPTGRVDPAYRGRRGAVETDGMVNVVRVWTFASPRLRAWDRFANWLSVSLGATLRIILGRTPVDIVYVSSPPITLMLPALAGSIKYRAALVAEVRDVFPDVAVKMGLWKPKGLAATVVGMAADLLYRWARLVVTVTDTCRDEILARGVPASKVVVVPNGFDAVEPSNESGIIRLPGKFIVAFVGNLGLVSGVDVIIDAAKLLAADGRYRFVLIGGGADAARLAGRIQRECADNVTLLGPSARPAALATLQAADACVVPLKRDVADSLPTKIFDAMALGTPVIACAGGEAARFVERSGGGLVTPPEDGAALAYAVRRLANDADLRAQCATRGRDYVTSNYDRSKLLAPLTARIDAIN